jgi:hypothetical protein
MTVATLSPVSSSALKAGQRIADTLAGLDGIVGVWFAGRLAEALKAHTDGRTGTPDIKHLVIFLEVTDQIWQDFYEELFRDSARGIVLTPQQRYNFVWWLLCNADTSSDQQTTTARDLLSRGQRGQASLRLYVLPSNWQDDSEQLREFVQTLALGDQRAPELLLASFRSLAGNAVRVSPTS